MHDLLYNPVFNALTSRDSHLGEGTASVKYFIEEVSPFAGFEDNYAKGFQDLHDLLPASRRILYATPLLIDQPAGWKIAAAIKGLQFVFRAPALPTSSGVIALPLGKEHVVEMIQLAALTKPGPFNSRTIEFGYYHGIFDDSKLVAMTGQRMHVGNYTEISAVCTHPDHLGKGYAAALLIHQLHLIAAQGQQAFLHVRNDNSRAIALYERIGFEVNRPMNFYFMKKQ